MGNNKNHALRRYVFLFSNQNKFDINPITTEEVIDAHNKMRAEFKLDRK